MNTQTHFTRSFFAGLAAPAARTRALGWMLAAVLAVAPSFLTGGPALAQVIPTYAQPPASQDETIQGRIASIDAKYAITVDDDRGFTDNVQLHPGTVINPTGLTLTPGMSVTIIGYNAGAAFVANQIDTPYTFTGPAPVPVYYGPGWWYPGFAYGYGPSFSLFLNFGSTICVQRPWYGYWYVHPAVRPWVGYRPPFAAPYGAYHNVPGVHTNVAINPHAGAPAPGSASERFPSAGRPAPGAAGGYPGYPGYVRPNASAGGYGVYGPSGGHGSYQRSAAAPRASSGGGAHAAGGASHGGGHR
jgi:hypothetical protein